MAFDFIHSKITGQAIGALKVTSGSVEYTGWSGNIQNICNISGINAARRFESGSVIVVRNGLILSSVGLTASAVTF